MTTSKYRVLGFDYQQVCAACCDELSAGIECLCSHGDRGGTPGYHFGGNGHYLALLQSAEVLRVDVKGNARCSCSEVAERSKDIVEPGGEKASLHLGLRVETPFRDGEGDLQRLSGLILKKLALHTGKTRRRKGEVVADSGSEVVQLAREDGQGTMCHGNHYVVPNYALPGFRSPDRRSFHDCAVQELHERRSVF